MSSAPVLTTLRDRYLLNEIIGHGGSASVYRATDYGGAAGRRRQAVRPARAA